MNGRLEADFWKDKRVLVTGGAGFIGSYVVEDLYCVGARVTVLDDLRRGHLDNLQAVPLVGARGEALSPVRGRINLWPVRIVQESCQSESACGRLMPGMDVLVHMAARVSNVVHNLGNNAGMFCDNLGAFLPVFNAAILARVPLFVFSSTVCVYGAAVAVPTPEEQGFLGDCEESNAGYGEAKRDIERSLIWALQEGLLARTAICRFGNAYGPRDYYDPGSAHVVAGLIVRSSNSLQRPLVVWGSGQQTRALTHARDLARGLLLVAEARAVGPSTADAVNVSAAEETTIAELAAEIRQAVAKNQEENGFEPGSLEVRFDATKPEGSTRRAYKVDRLRDLTGWTPGIDLQEGLAETVRDFSNRRNHYLVEKPRHVRARGDNYGH